MSLVVLFDTNVLISASISLTGPPFRCPALARAGQAESVTCLEILEEYRTNLISKILLSPESASLAVEQVKKFSRLVTIPGTLKGVTIDPDDHKVLECAVAGGATHIVTGDRRHLLPLREYKGIAIVSPGDFLAAGSKSE